MIYPEKRLLKARKARHANRQLRARHRAWCEGRISFDALDASVCGWINHAGHADNWGLRRRVLRQIPIRQKKRAEQALNAPAQFSGQRTVISVQGRRGRHTTRKP